MSAAKKRTLFIENRNKKIIEKIQLGFSPRQIVNFKDKKGKPLFTKGYGEERPLSVTMIRRIQKTHNVSIQPENIIHIYRESPIKTQHNDVESSWAAALQNTNFDDFMKSCGYENDGIINRGARARKNYKDGVFYIVRYQDNGLDVLKYGISTSHYQEKRWACFRATNIRKGFFSENVQHEVLFTRKFDTYNEAQLIELGIKKSLTPAFSKEQLPDGYSETVLYSESMLKNIKSMVDNPVDLTFP